MVGLRGLWFYIVPGCQTRAWRSMFYIKASLVYMVLWVLILYQFPFYAILEARLGVQVLYYANIHPKIKPLFLFFWILWILLEFAGSWSKKSIGFFTHQQINKNIWEQTLTWYDIVLYRIRVLCKTIWPGNNLVILGITIKSWTVPPQSH